MEQLIDQLRHQIVSALNLEDIDPSDIAPETPLFGEGLGLDSIDALELILLMDRQYGIKVKNATEARPIFKNLQTMADYIAQNRTK